jgi:Domain of unknown function (DUF4157)
MNSKDTNEKYSGLPEKLKLGIEYLSGYSMDDVIVHYNSTKPAEIQAHAYAQGTNVYLGPGQENHLPHEAWHVVQQKQGRVKPMFRFGGRVDINNDIVLEIEAEVMGWMAQRTLRPTNSLAHAPILGQAVIQKAIDTSTLRGMFKTDEHLFGGLERSIETYNSISTTDLNRLQDILAGLETKIYDISKTRLDSSMIAKLKKLMDQVQRGHIQVIGTTILSGMRPKWLDQDESEPVAFNATWSKIISGKGNLKVIEFDIGAQIRHMLSQGVTRNIEFPIAFSQFRYEMFSALARLMAYPLGFQLIQELTDHIIPVYIVPKTNSLDWLFSRLFTERPKQTAVKEAPCLCVCKPSTMDVQGLERSRRECTQNMNPGTSMPLIRHRIQGKPIGVESWVAIRPELTDSKVFTYNRAGSEILSPVYVSLGHELLHAKHNIEGVSSLRLPLHEEFQIHYPNYEELMTIELDELSENKIRSEHFLDERHGHAGSMSL